MSKPSRVTVSVTMTEHLYRLVKSACTAQDVHVSTWVRECIKSRLSDEGVGDPILQPFMVVRSREP